MGGSDWSRIPWSIVLATVGLLAAGMLGIARGDELRDGTDFATRQLVWIGLSLPALVLAALVPYHRLRHFSYAIFALSLLLLVAVYFLPAKNGSHRWIPLGPANLQPSEVAKLAFVLATAQYLRHRSGYRRLTGLLVPFGLAFVPLALILKEPDLGTSLLFLPVLFAMLFAAGARPRHLVSVALLGIATMPVLWWGMSAEQRSRITTVFSQQDGGPTPPGDGFHLHQSKQMLLLGGTWGSEVVGPAVDDARAYVLPEGRTDFVFCLVGERFGLVGCVGVLAAYGLLFAGGLAVAHGTREPFGRLLAVGITALLATQTAINTGMTVGLMPITGMTLPLASYGGSSLLSTCIALGLLVNVAVRPGYEVAPDPFRFAEGR